jgi:biotin/methionine sulfoxide reductase
MSARSYTAAHWGVYEVEASAEGGPPRILPFSGDADPSPIGRDQLDPSVAALRVRRPAVRRSWLEQGPGANSDRRGAEDFIEVDWPEALDRLAAEITRVRRAYGAEAIFGGSYGWASAGRFHHAQGQLHRFFNTIGGYVRSVDSYSLGAGRVVMPHVAGTMDDLCAAHTSWDVLAEHCQLFVAFGGVPLKNAQVSPGGAGAHRGRDGLRRMAGRGTRFINISPVRDNLDTGGAVEWIPIRPNTDVALMLGLAYVIHRDNRFDRAFIDRCTVGFDRFTPYLTGEADGMPKDPVWASAITGVPAERISSLAREMLGARTLLNIAWALQRAAHGEQPFWMLVTLAAMLGQIGLPGGGYGLGYGAMNQMGSAHPAAPGPTLHQGVNPVKAFIPVARIADMLLQPGESFRYDGGAYIYPDIKLIYWAGGNPFHHHQDLNRLLRAWRRPQTIVVQEQFWTPAAKLADIVLPVTTTLERDDIGFARREGWFIAMKKAVAPVGEARDDYAIFAGLAERLGVADTFTEGLDARGWLERLYEENAGRARDQGLDLPSFADFWERGLIDLSIHDRPVVMHQDFRRDPEAHPLGTPSGKIEIFSETIASFGLADCAGHAAWREPFEWLGHVRAKAYPLHLLSDQPARRLHGQLDHSPHSRAGKIAGREPVYLNPADARQRGIADGDVVELFNDRGRCLAGAIVSDDIAPGVARLNTGAWFDPDGELEKHGNPNSLTLDCGSSSLSQGCSAQTCLVEARRFEGEPPRVTAHDLPALGRAARLPD